ncbi:MAG TPA: helix-turn-helix transcriptional regulator [Anaerolineales bacterium]|nr:helix-turn-helix transcriptional regulator [Anaerolineales bacterium]
MNLLNWLRRLFTHPGKPTPRAPERFEDTIQIEHQEITKPLREIAESQQRSPEDIANEILFNGIEKYEHFDEKLAKWNALSFREQQVTALACRGYLNEDIAQKLIISPNTVKTHIRNIQYKFNVRSKVELKELFQGWDFSEFDH